METETRKQILNALARARLLFTRTYVVEGGVLTEKEELAESLLEKAQTLLDSKTD